MSDIKALAEDMARGSAQDIEQSHKAAFYAELTRYRAGESTGAHLHAVALRVLPRHLYQLFCFYYLHNGSAEAVRRRLAPMSLSMFERWCDEVAEAIGKELEKSR